MSYSIFLIIIKSISFLFSDCSPVEKTKIYLLPGQGSDYRIFQKLTFPPQYETVNIIYDTPLKGESMSAYAQRLSAQIKEEDGFILVGVSMGGMLASEIATLKKPKKIIIISSAKNAKELPKRYTFQQSIPIYKTVGPRLSKWGAQILQPWVEPDRNQEKETFKAMLADKNPIYLKRTIAMIINWDRQQIHPSIVHIHGDNDHTIPIKNVDADYVIENGSHMMTLTEHEVISTLLNDILHPSSKEH